MIYEWEVCPERGRMGIQLHIQSFMQWLTLQQPEKLPDIRASQIESGKRKIPVKHMWRQIYQPCNRPNRSFSKKIKKCNFKPTICLVPDTMLEFMLPVNVPFLHVCILRCRKVSPPRRLQVLSFGQCKPNRVQTFQWVNEVSCQTHIVPAQAIKFDLNRCHFNLTEWHFDPHGWHFDLNKWHFGLDQPHLYRDMIQNDLEALWSSDLSTNNWT